MTARTTWKGSPVVVAPGKLFLSGEYAVLEGLKGPHVVHSQLQGKEAVLVDGEALGAPFDLLLAPQLSPDGTRYACVGRRGEAWTLIVDGQPRLDPAFATALVWSPDSRRLAYDARQQPKGSPPPASSDPTLLACAGVPIFREDGARLAVLESAGSGLRWFVVEGVAGPSWETSVLFSQATSDGSLTFTEAAGLRYVATREGAICAVTERVP